jgi:alpha-mannosidase
MRLTVELTPEEEIALIRNETQFDYCTWEESDQLEEIIECTFEDADVEGVQEASESRLLAHCKSAEDAELVLRMFNILQRAMQEAQ